VVAVVGAGHVRGLLNYLKQSEPVDLKPLEHVPPASPMWKIAGYGIPALIVGSIAYIGWTKGAEAAGSNILYWILANGIPSSIGALIAMAHPLTILAAFVAAPLTSLTPVIGAGYVTAFIQAWLQPPRVRELKSVAEDMGHVKRWWSNRLLKVFLAFLLPGFGSMIGTYVGGYEIIKNLF
jgi:pheromone shutdown protein TraB